MITKKLKRKWVAALRGGNYIQARATLRIREHSGRLGHCVLGVLLDVAGLTFDPGDYTNVHELLGEDLGEQLYRLNDGTQGIHQTGMSFPQLADWIEEHVLPDA